MNEGKGIRVAIADDHDLMRNVTITCLRTYGYKITLIAEDGQELIELLEQSSPLPQVLILDINMPRMNGLEATKIICHRWPSIKIIGFSINEDASGRVAMLNAGADTCIVKGDDPENLHTSIVTAFYNAPKL